MGKKLYVGNLNFGVDSTALQDIFAQYGNVQSAQVISDRETGRSKGFGFVEMSSDSEAAAAIEGLNGRDHQGRALTVNEAKPREDRPRGGGGGGGGGGWGGGGWGGGGRNSVTIFRDSEYRGPSFRFDNEMPNLANTGFNDAISSMRFQGEWEACTDAYYRGFCQTFRGDVRNLQRWGMNDRISSLRPVRGGGRW